MKHGFSIIVLVAVCTLPITAGLPIQWQAAQAARHTGANVGSGYDLFSDSFTRGDGDTLGGNWTEANGDTDIDSNSALMTSASFTPCVNVYSASACMSVNQYAKFTIVAGVTEFPMAVLRYTDASSAFYAIQASSTDIEWLRYPTSGGSSSQIGSTDTSTLAPGDTVGVTITGTGASTVVRLWINPTGAVPDSATSWGGDSTPNVTWTDDPVSPVDTGSYVGFSGEQGTGSNIRIDDWSGGGGL